MSKGMDALRSQRQHEDPDIPLRVVDAGIAAYRRCVEERIAPPMEATQVHAMVVRIYRAMRFAVL